MMRYHFQVSLTVVLLFTCSQPLAAGDWPQILGQGRDGVAVGEKLLASWPADGPETSWKHPLGAGYAGVAIASNRVIVFHRVEDQERVQALAAATGKVLWQTDFEAHYRGGGERRPGPPLCAAGSQEPGLRLRCGRGPALPAA